MIKRQFLHMVGSFVEVADQIQHITPSQFEHIIKDPHHSLLKQLYALEKEIYEVRMSQEGTEPGTKKKKEVEELKSEEVKKKDPVKPDKPKLEEPRKDPVKADKPKSEETRKDPVKPDTKQEKSEETRKDPVKQDKPKLEETRKDPVKPDAKKDTKQKPKKEDEKQVELDKNPVSEDMTWEDTSEPLCMKKRSIPKHIRTLVWNKYIGADNANAKCVSCKEERIDCRSFHCGHVLSEAKGGDLTITNLRPICSHCNLSMGTRSMNEFTLEFFGWEI
jgi:hypothetical protein